MQEKQSNIIFLEGKERILQRLFNDTGFGYLAVGHNQETDDTNGFRNVSLDDNVTPKGFTEVSDSTYERVPLEFDSIKNVDEDNGRVTARFSAELGLDNIINNVPINQIAIVDNKDKTVAETKFFGASVTEEFTKNEKLALVFIIEITI